MLAVEGLRRLLRVVAAASVAGFVLWAFAYMGWQGWRNHEAGKDRPVKLTVLHWGEPPEVHIVEQLVGEFERSHPKVRVERISVASDNFDAKLKTMMAAGTPPDVFYLPPRLIADLASDGLIRSMDEWEARERRTPEGRAYFDDLYPVLLETFRFDPKTQRTGEGPLWGLPKDVSPAVFYVNLDLFEKAGVKVPYGGWTWGEFEEACRKISKLSGTPAVGGQRIYGGNFELWWENLRNVIWTFGGDYFGPGGFRDVTLDEPAAQEALGMIRRLRIEEKTVYNSTVKAQDGSQEFFSGTIGMTGPVGRWKTPRFAAIKNFRWDIVPMPSKRPELAATILFTNAWTVSSGTKHEGEAFELLKFLCSREGAKMQSELGLGMPPLQSLANSPAFLSPPGIPAYHAELFLKAMEHARVAQNPRQAEWARLVDDQIKASIQLGTQDTMTNAKRIESAWLNELDTPLRKRVWPAFPWTGAVTVALGGVVTAVAALWWRARRERIGVLAKATQRAGYGFILPWLVGFVLLTAGPMVVSLLLSFGEWTGMTPLSGAKWVGTANYQQVVLADPTFWKSLRVTGYYVLLAVPATQIGALGVALMMNLKLRGIGFFRTVYFVPSVISGVALAVLWLQIFNNDYGLLNTVLRPVFGWAPDWFGVDAPRWAIPAYVLMSLWSVGGGMIIYLAGLKGISASLYEAAWIDGAGPVRRFWSVTLPMLSPLIFYNLVMGVIGSFQVFTQAFVMTEAGPDNSTLFYVLNLYRQAFEFHNMGYASAMAWILFLICLVLTGVVFRSSKGLVYYEGLKQ